MRAALFLPSLLLTAVALAAAAASAPAPESRTPEETVRAYLSAIEDQEFSKAYDLVSQAMKTDRQTGEVKSREVWVKESQYVVQFSGLEIYEFRVFPGEVEGDVARVPNLLSSKDRFLNQLGIDEHELYILVREDGEWKIDSQTMVIDAAGMKKWFPEVTPKPRPTP